MSLDCVVVYAGVAVLKMAPTIESLTELLTLDKTSSRRTRNEHAGHAMTPKKKTNEMRSQIYVNESMGPAENLLQYLVVKTTTLATSKR